MKVYHLNTYLKGGASRSAFRIHESLLKVGLDSQFIFARGTGETGEGIIRLREKKNHAAFRSCAMERFFRPSRLIENKENATFKSFFRSAYRPRDLTSFPKPDLWMLHWVSGLMDWPTMLPWLVKTAPVYWVLHDLNPLMGLWHYPPRKNEETQALKRLDNKLLRNKQRIFDRVEQKQMHFIAPSTWMAKEIVLRFGNQFPVKRIPIGIDTEKFKPMGTHESREQLGMARDDFVIGFAAESLSDPRKGFPEFLEALRLLNYPKVKVVTVGRRSATDTGIPLHQLGYLGSDAALARFYSAIDLFVCPSMYDNFPNTVLESIACGTPVLAYATGGIGDMVRDGKTGWLCQNNTPEDLAMNLSRILEGKVILDHVARECRELALREYALDVIGRRYQEVIPF